MGIPSTYIGFQKKYWRVITHKEIEIEDDEGNKIIEIINYKTDERTMGRIYIEQQPYTSGKDDYAGLNKAWEKGDSPYPTEISYTDQDPDWEKLFPTGSENEEGSFDLEGLSQEEKQLVFEFLITVWDKLRQANNYTDDDTPYMIGTMAIVQEILGDFYLLNFRSELYKLVDLDREDLIGIRPWW
jgi:hypothetical protein